ncbi:MAG: amidohydrolase family protein [Lentisphaeria bacterium]|nr:amidohydrolase family protein [Lentisphaeria bacterium]
MKYIDVHSHLFPPGVAEKVIDALENYYHSRWEGTGELDDLLRNLRQARITRSVIFSSATKPSQVIPINNFISRLQEQYPELLIGFGTLHPEFGDIAGETERIRSLGLRGLKFHPDFQQFCIDDPVMDPIYEAVGSDLPLLFHIGDYRTEYSKPERLLKIHRRFPELKLIAAHMGGYSEWDLAWKYLIGTDILLDISSTIKFLPAEEVRRMVEVHGPDKVLFASDYPGTLQSRAVRDVLSLGLSDADNELIFYRNAERLLGIRL